MIAERERRFRALAPRVVALGGGHGLAASLQAAQSYASNIVGIVSVADDGGSSGRLRRELGLPAPGDLRRCLSALASDDSLIARSLEHRFEVGSLEGHPLGNLLLAGLAEAGGDFQQAITEVARLVGAVGTIYPATHGPVTLLATTPSGPIRGQVTIEASDDIRDLRFDPPDPQAPSEAVAAILAADQVIIGPGSLFTSVLACALVPNVLDALRDTTAQRVFVANVANDRAEARGFDLVAHIETLGSYGVPVDVILADAGGQAATGEAAAGQADAGQARVRRGADAPADVVVGETRLRRVSMAAADGWGHRPDLLGRALGELYAELATDREIN